MKIKCKVTSKILMTGIIFFTVLASMGLIQIMSNITIRAAMADDFAGGAGTSTNPYKISSAIELQNLNKYLGLTYSNVYYELTCDIDLTGFLNGSSEGWNSIGTTDASLVDYYDDAFTSTLNGNGYKVTGLWADTIKSYTGLFGYTYKATIYNIGVEVSEAGLKGEDHVGGLVGHSNDSTIYNCYATGNMKSTYTGSWAYVGGLIGKVEEGSTTNCYATGNVEAVSTVIGGFAGQITGTATNCYATGNADTTNFDDGIAGGFVGAIGGTILNCYATGNASGTLRVGAFVGYVMTNANPVSIDNCYATGIASGASDIGGFVGTVSGATFINCYFVNGAFQSSAVKVEASELKKSSHAAYNAGATEWDFDDIWYVIEDETYPLLKTINYCISIYIGNDKVQEIKYNCSDNEIVFSSITNQTHIYNGFYTASDKAQAITSIIPYLTLSNINIYADATSSSFTITIKAQANGSVDKTSVEDVSYGSAVTVVGNRITINGTIITATPASGYEFEGWNVSNGKELTGAGEIIATFKTIEYTITYNLNGGNWGSVTGIGSYTIATATFNLNNPTRTEYIFRGWYENSNFSGNAVTSIAKGSTGNKTYYAKWEIITYSITYNLNGGNWGSITKIESYTAETENFALSVPTNAGYTFQGWYQNPSFSGSAVTSITKGSTGNKTYYAKWEIISYSVTYNLNGGSWGSIAKTESYTVETETFNLNAPTRTEYIFRGWYGTSNFSGSAVTNIVKGSTGNKTYYAKWEVISYSITYNLNGGNWGSVTEVNSYTIETGTFNLSIPTKAGYIFQGWYETADFSGSEVRNIILGSIGNKIFYANWKLYVPVIDAEETIRGNTKNGLSVALNEASGLIYTYQWQIKQEDGSWEDIAGATNNILKTFVNGTYEYRCYVTITDNNASFDYHTASKEITYSPSNNSILTDIIVIVIICLVILLIWLAVALVMYL